MEILIAFLVVLAIALVAGISLLIFSRLFFVEKNPLEKKIRDCLPGVNCGACGYKGCDDYAASLAEGGVKPNLCIPGDQMVADEICAILGVEAEKIKDVVAFVACNGTCDATKKTSLYEGVQSCSAASMLFGGNNSCRFGCLGLGDCAKACPAQAICLEDGVARVITSRCIGCGLCNKACPKGIISMVPQEISAVVMCSNKQKGADAMKACKNACIGCKKCEKACPEGAIKVTDNLAVIDYNICKKCGVCTDVCPTGCLKKVFLPDIPRFSYRRLMKNKNIAVNKIRNDIIFILVLLAVSLLGFVYLFFFRSEGDALEVTVNGKLYGTYSLSKDACIEISTGEEGENKNTFVISDGKACMIEASCPDGICVLHRSVFRDGESIVCLPNKVVLTVISEGNNDGADIVA